MESTTLKILRLLSPGILLWLFIFSISIAETNLYLVLRFHKDFWFIWILPLIYFFGAILYSFNVRSKFHTTFVNEIEVNIKTQMLEIFKKDKEVASKTNYLREGKKLIQIFYHFVDSNNSLSIKAKSVYLNGFFWSTAVDIAVFTRITAILYLLLLVARNNVIYFWFFVCSIILFYSSTIILMPLLTENHINLSNDQIDFIRTNLRTELRNKLIELIDNR